MLEQSMGHGEHVSVSQSQEWALTGRVVVLVVVGWGGRGGRQHRWNEGQ